MRKKLKNRPTQLSIGHYQLSIFYLLVVLLTACASKNEQVEADTYTCPMHPTVISDKQGVCPVCNMDLVRKARPGEEVEITEDLARLIKSPNTSVVTSIRTVKGDYKSMPVAIEGTGVVTYDTRQLITIPARIGGRLEHVFLKYPFQPVRQGQKIATVYSPDLVTAQQELLYLMKQDPDNTLLMEAAKNKLRLLGVSEGQLNELMATHIVQYQYTLFSTQAGYLITETQPAPGAPLPTSTGMGMATSVAPVTSMKTLVREGDYVTAGQPLFKVINTTAVRIELNLSPEQGRWLHLQQEVELSINQSVTKGRIDFIQPFYNNNEEFIKVWMYVRNLDLKIGTLVTAQWTVPSAEALWVPRLAVVDLGNQSVVFVKERGAFVPRVVTVNARTNDSLDVQGLSSSDEIAADAHYLVDSEGFVRMKN